MPASVILWLFALLFTPAGSLVGILAYRKIHQARHLLRHGTVAQGVVTRLERTRIAPASDINSNITSYGTTVYYPVIAWNTADGRPMESRAQIARPQGSARPVGARVEVRYDPADPLRWALPEEGNTFWWLIVALGALFGMVGLGFFFGALLYSS